MSATRAARVYLALGILWSFNLLHRVVYTSVESVLLRRLWSGNASSETVLRTWRLLVHSSELLTVAQAVAAAIAFVTLIRALPRARSLLVGGLVALGVEALVAAAFLVVPEEVNGAALKLFYEHAWVVQRVAESSAVGLALAAGMGAIASHARVQLWLLFGANLGLEALQMGATFVNSLTRSHADDAVRWAVRGLFFAAAAVATVAAFRLRTKLMSDSVHSPPRVDGEVHGGSLRTLAWGVGAHMAISVAGQALFGWALVSKEYGAMGVILLATWLLNACAAVVIGKGLLAYLKLPATLRRGGAVVFALCALGLGVILDLGGALMGAQLFDLVGQASRATSFWGGPSLREMEGLQTALRATTGIAIALGLSSALAFASSLKRTAVGVCSAALVSRATTTTTLIALTGASALGLAIAVGVEGDLGLIVMVALLVLALAIGLLVTWFSLLQGLARALDHDVPVS